MRGWISNALRGSLAGVAIWFFATAGNAAAQNGGLSIELNKLEEVDDVGRVIRLLA